MRKTFGTEMNREITKLLHENYVRNFECTFEICKPIII